MNVAQIFYCDIANGPGMRVSLFVSGCTHHCEGCFNEVAWDFNYGVPFDQEQQDYIINHLNHDFITGLSLLGGEPMEPQNQKALRPFLERVRHEFPGKTIWCYSGYTWEQLTDPDNKRCHTEDTLPILHMIDVLVDGEFVQAKKNISLEYRGSSNQRIIDVPKTLEEGHMVFTQYQREIFKPKPMAIQ